MSKKTPRTKSDKTSIPQSAQLEAVRKLSRAGRCEEAQARVMELRERYPDFKPLLALAWEVQYNAENFSAATMHAWDWSHASPNSVSALEALGESALRAGMLALSASAAQRLAQITDTPQPDLPPILGELGDLSFEDAVAMDLSRLLLMHNRFAETSALLEPIDHPSARNNYALALFSQGKIAAARDDIESNWRDNKNNFFALHHVVRLRLWMDGQISALELKDALVEAKPARPEDGIGQMHGLLLLGAHGEATAAWSAMRDADFWHRNDSVLQSHCAHFAAIAALRQNNLELAREFIDQAEELDPENEAVAALELALAMGDLIEISDCKAGEFHDWFPSTWVSEMRRAAGKSSDDTALDFLYRRCDAHPDYLTQATEIGGPAARYIALSVLKLRVSDGNPAALAALRGLLVRPCGPDEVRFELRRWLQEKGYLQAGEACKMLVRGEISELDLRAIRLTDEPTESGLPEVDQDKLEHMHRLLKHAHFDEGLRIAQELVARHPRNPMLIGNLASIEEALRYPDDEIEALYQQASEIDPDYLFAQAGLARLAARKGDTQRAEDLLKQVFGREEYHFTEWRAILLVQQAIARKQGDLAKVAEIAQGLRSLEEEFR